MPPLTSGCVAAVPGNSTLARHTQKNLFAPTITETSSKKRFGGGAFRDRGRFLRFFYCHSTSCRSTLSRLLSADGSKCAAVIGSAGGGGEKPAAALLPLLLLCLFRSHPPVFHLTPSVLRHLLLKKVLLCWTFGDLQTKTRWSEGAEPTHA